MKNRLSELLYFLLREILEEERDIEEDGEEIRSALYAEGFDEEEVEMAFQWLENYFQALPGGSGEEELLRRATAQPRSLRVLSFDEGMHIKPEAHGFLLQLESRGLIAPETKEEIMHRSMHMFEEMVGLEEMKMVTLLTIFEQGSQNIDEIIRMVDGGSASLTH